MIEQEINKLKGRIIGFSYHVENMLDKSLKGLSEGDKSLLKHVIKEEEPQANKFDKSIDKQCIGTMARYSPKAIDLRLILMIMKMNNDLERMADHCVNIAYNSRDIMKADDSYSHYYGDILAMGGAVKKMLKESILSFVEEDIELAKNVCDEDKTVNDYQKKLTEFFTEEMKKKTDHIECYLNFIEIVNNLERIADLSTNLAEDIVFIFKGKVIKH